MIQFIDTTIRLAEDDDLKNVKHLAHVAEKDIGFLTYQAFRESIDAKELLVAIDGNSFLGFARYHRRRDGWVTLYDIVVRPDARRQKIGSRLIHDLVQRLGVPIQLKCPEGTPANEFYRRLGFTDEGLVDGRKRRLNRWTATSLEQLRFD